MVEDDRLLLVQNRRRNGSLDWSPPGGVVDEGEDVLTGLQREVVEETGLVVDSWSEPRYLIHAVAPDMGWDLRVEARQASSFRGELVVDDPDGIVVASEWVSVEAVAQRLAGGPRWVSEPLVQWLADGPASDIAPGTIETFSYVVSGTNPGEITVRRID